MNLSEDEKRLSKIYRKIVTSSEYKAGQIIEKLDHETKDKVIKLIRLNKSGFEKSITKESYHQ
ncbi:hypothetical protein [Pseudalkalibacillus caeni]|uniref:Uncharacterized protein n=1 Tax=Exobacillus caeni TaxID=2574798 RepID=A0A5R9F685_9BACL|nr:hypothetical protein [Pseudalkalibacillus caeni]TLS38009.1 hypothetical protein FCL54_05535 [Pseudalkalibacillus caeni]